MAIYSYRRALTNVTPVLAELSYLFETGRLDLKYRARNIEQLSPEKLRNSKGNAFKSIIASA